ncbi:EAL domain-containing protein [Pseudoroseicyclus sp. H15]
MTDNPNTGCSACRDGGRQAFRQGFTMAFQPVIDVGRGEIFAHEALVRPLGGGSAAEVLGEVTTDNRYSFDQRCRTRAIEVASRLGIDTRLSINFMPNAVYNPDHCIQATLRAAERHSFPTDRLIFEFTEGEAVRDTAHLAHIVSSYRSRGFLTAIDDFGAGYSGLSLLCDLQPDIVKLDISLVRGIAGDERRRLIVAALQKLCLDLGILPLAEGIETAEDASALADIGITHMQGFYFARPTYERLTRWDEIPQMKAA